VHVEGGPRRVNHAAVTMGDKVFSFGGFCTGDNYREKRPIDVFVLNTITYRWTQINDQEYCQESSTPPRPSPQSKLRSHYSEQDPIDEGEDWPFQRYGHTVVAYGEDIYLFGGRNDRTPCNRLYKFDTNTFKWSRPKVTGYIPGERDGHSACVIGKYMFVFGGYEDAFERFPQDLFRLDLETMNWTLLACNGDPPIHRDFHSATPVGINMYIFGGRSTTMTHPRQDFYSNKVCYLDTSTNTWHLPHIPTPAPSGRRSHSALSIDNRILIFGGYNGRRGLHMNDLWSLDTNSMTWSQLNPRGTPPSPRRRQAMCLVRSKMFLFGGTSPHDGPPLYFTPDQLALLPPHQEDEHSEHSSLMDHNDLHILDLNPSLKTLCILEIVRNKINTEGLPATILEEMKNMLTSDIISKPLRTIDTLTSG